MIIATYNGSRHVGAALASVRMQSWQPEEIIVVDAGSNDDTVAQLHLIAAQYSKLRVLAATERLTAPQARNIALQQVRTAVVATLDQDDLMSRHRLRDQVSGLVASPQLVALGGHLINVDSAGVARPRRVNRNRRPHGKATSAERIRWMTIRNSPTLSSGLSFRTALLRNWGGFDEDHPLIDDYALLARLAEQSAVAVDPTVVGRYRKHEHMSSVRHRSRQLYQLRLLQWRLIHERLGLHPTLGAVAALVHPEQSNHGGDILEALNLWELLFDEAGSRSGSEAADLDWIAADYLWLKARLERKWAEIRGARE